jgi:hypothetical protein
MIITKIHGGLGNQMFQYAIAKSIAKNRGDVFKLDTNFFLKQSLREYELSFLNVDENIAGKLEIKVVAGNVSFFNKILNKIGIKTKKPKSYYKEKEKTIYDGAVFNYSSDIYLDGYWQNERYFKDIKEEIVKDFSLKAPLSLQAKKHRQEIELSNSISLHVRRGDYISNIHTNNVHGTCDVEYYKKAIDKITQKVPNSIFYIFSDDIQWCKKTFDFIDNKVFVDDTQSALEDLELMKNCKHHIIANSSFSWWGAWLNQSKDKIVISPKNWMRHNPKGYKWVPEEWLQI